MALDCVLLLALGLAAQSAAFTSKMGRAIVCIDSYQYIATAEALLDPELTPHFEMRKPGYPLFLAGVKLLTGRLGWTAVVANHFLLAMLPLAAYGFGVHLRSRGLGWFAAILLLARLQTAFSMRTADFGNWMMSEALFTFLLSFALLLFFAGLRRDRFVRWMVPAGFLMGSAWLTRGTMTAIIPIAFLAILWVHRSRLRRTLAASVAFMLPIVAFVIFECSLNLTCGGQFRPSHGTGGSCMWAYRMQAFQGAEVPDSDEGRFLLSLIRERAASDAYVASGGDQWVSIARAVRHQGMDAWAFDDLCRRVAMDAVDADRLSFLGNSLELSAYHLLRMREPGMSISPVSESRRAGVITFSPSDRNTGINRTSAHWALPYRTAAASVDLANRVRKRAEQRAPFAGSGVWSAMAYWKTKPIVITACDMLTRIGSLWPGFALLLCPWLGLNRRTCFILAAMYIVEAACLSIITVTDQRYQSVWMVCDTALAAALPVCALAWLSGLVRNRLARAIGIRKGSFATSV